jgi:hypothetical protein
MKLLYLIVLYQLYYMLFYICYGIFFIVDFIMTTLLAICRHCRDRLIIISEEIERE